MGLSLRLNSILERCEPGLPLWDLCCDHGQLGLAALASGHFPEVIFNDSVKRLLEPIQLQLVGHAGCRFVCSLAEDISEPLTGNVVLAGIGGEKIFRILSAHAGCQSLLARKIIACPEKDAEWMAQQKIPGFVITEHLTIPHNHGVRQIYSYAGVELRAVRPGHPGALLSQP